MTALPQYHDNTRLFTDLLEDFPVLIAHADALRTAESEIDPLAIKIAVVGYGLFRPKQEWGKAIFAYVHSFIYEDPPPLAPVEAKYLEAASVFAALCLGALIGRENAEEIVNEKVARGEFNLVFFIIQRASDIDAAYRSVESTSPTGLASPYNLTLTDDEDS